jgi:N-carbamoylputrescine amidase
LPGGTGFKVWDTAAGRIGLGICWDQWFPEAARVMALMGAEILLNSTAIGSEPPNIAEMDRVEEGIRLAEFDLAAIAELRRSWGLFRDRRPELYGALLTLDGRNKSAAG